MDALGYPTHNSTGTPTYGSGTSYSVSSTGSGTSRTETISYIGEGWAVIGPNSGTNSRSLPANYDSPNFDPAAFGQVGKVGLGDIEISDDGQYLFVTNLYDKKIYQLQLNSVTNPTSASVVASYSLPSPPYRSQSGYPYAAATYFGANDNTDFYTGSRGVQRPFGLKYYRGHLYVGAVTTGEGPNGTTSIDNGIGNPEYTDLWGYVWEFTPSTGFNSTPVLQFPMNFDRGNNDDGYNETFEKWDNTFPAPTHLSLLLAHHAQPMLSDIDFDEEGAMILAVRDRFGDQTGYQNYMMTSSTDLRSSWTLGDIYRSYYNANTCRYEMENNAKEGPSSPKGATLGIFCYQGPSGGEFYFEDGLEQYNSVSQNVRAHKNVTMGTTAVFPGKTETTITTMDPMDFWSGGVSWFSNVNGGNHRDYEIYYGANVGLYGKANGLGDVELFGQNAPFEIGNRVWNDANADGIQNAGESGIANVSVLLYTNGADGIPGNGDDANVGTTSTNSTGNYYFTTRTGTDGGGVDYGVTINPNTGYNIRIGSLDWNSSSSAGTGDLVSLFLTRTNITGNGAVDESDNDASLNSSNFPMITFTTGDYGQNRHSYDFGFAAAFGNLGNRVWFDQNANGVFDEASSYGINGITVELYKETSAGSGVYNLSATTTTTNDTAGLPGYYNFTILSAANYKVKFINTSAIGTSQTLTAATDNNSDPYPATGFTTVIAMNPSGSGVAKNNYTIDAGFRNLRIGDYVWLDADADGVQDANEAPISNVVLELYTNTGTAVNVCKNDNEATDFGSVSDNDGSFVFGGDWIITGTGSSITGGELLVSGQTGIAKRDVTLPLIYTVDTVLVTFDMKDFGISNSETFIIEYHNGTSWQTLASLNGTSTSTTYATFRYSNLTRSGYTVVSGLNTIDSIRFRELTMQNADILYVDNLNIQFKKACAAATATTDANGLYYFTALQHDLQPSTQYQIRIAKSQSNVVNYSVTGTSAGTSSTDNNGTDAGTYITSGNFTTPATGDDLTIDFGFKGYSIGNLVFWDNNNNGTKDSGEPGIPDVDVSLLNSNGAQIATTVTDVNGNYYFRGLASGIYQVAITSSLTSGTLAGSTRSTATLTDDVDNNSNGNSTYASGNTPVISYSAISDTITLKSRLEPTNETDEDPVGTQPDNQSNLTVDFGFYRFTIGDFVWIDQDADGIQDSGEPGIAGVELELCNSSGNLIYGGCATQTVSTNFASNSNNTGTKNFDGNWSTNTGITITGGELQVSGTANAVATRNINQPSNYPIDTVRISFNLKQVNVSKTENFVVEYLDSTTSTWVVLADLFGVTDAVGSIETFYRTYNFNSLTTPGLKNIAGIRFREGSPGYANADIVYVDNLSITFSQGCIPARVETDSNGYYNFNSSEHGLTTSTTYQIRILETQNELHGLKATLTGQGTTSTDNNGTDGGTYISTGNITTPSSGQNLTFDFGFYPSAIGNYVWMDKDVDGIQDNDESGIPNVVLGLFYPSGDVAGCGSDNVATTFNTNTHNSGTINFSGNWVLKGSAAIASNVLTINALSDSARRHLIPPTNFNIDTVVVSFGMMRNAAFDAGDNIFVEYLNGTTWSTIATIAGSSLNTSTLTTFTYNSTSIAGLKNIRGIRFSGGTGITSGEIATIDNLSIRLSETCVPVPSQTTDANGYYLFDVDDGLRQSVNYEIKMLKTQSALTGLSPTISGAGTAATDNNGADSGTYISTAVFTSPAVGENLTYDFGFTGYSIGNLVWLDDDNDGLKDAGENGIQGVNVALLNSTGTQIATTTTDANGKYWFGGLYAGNYQVAITSPTTSGPLLGATLSPTISTTDADNNNNGRTVDPVGLTTISFTAISESVTLGAQSEPTGESDAVSGTNNPDNQSNLTIDFGFNKILIGNYVWFDADADGVQDNNERGIKGVTLGLYTSGGSQVYVCNNRNFASGFASASDNSGTNTFNGDWVLKGSAAIASNVLTINALSDSARRHLIQPNNFTFDTVVVSFGMMRNAAFDAGDNIFVEYLNGTTWTSLATIAGSSLNASTLTTFTYKSNTVSGLTNIRGIRFGGGTGITSGEIATIDNVDISFKKACVAATSTTDANGFYEFDGGQHGLVASTNYQIRITESQDSILNYSVTSTGKGTTSTDNNGTDAGSYITSGTITSPATGENTTFDFGFTGYSIGNRVWWDNNNNGTLNTGEIGIGGVTVALLNESGTVIRTTTTNSTGNYYFGGLNAGNYQVAVTSPMSSGILAGASIPSTTTTADVDNNNNGSATDPLGVGHTSAFYSSISELVTLGSKAEPTNESDEDPISDQPDNQSNLTIDFGFVPPATALGNFVYHDVNMDGDHDAATEGFVANVKMYLFKDLDGNGVAETKIDSTLTNSTGFYQFVNLGAGVFKITVASSNFLTGGPLENGQPYTNANSGDTITDNNGEGLSSTNIWLRPNVQPTNDAGDNALSGIDDNDANFTFDFGFNGGATPVTWLHFKANLINDKDVLLNWATASEINNSHFEVERSTDGVNFVKIGTEKSKAPSGQSNIILNYYLTDFNVANTGKQTLYYRVKQVDFDGSFAYTNIEVIKLKFNSTTRVYPNPTKDDITISFTPASDDEEVIITVTDMAGKVVYTEKATCNFNQQFIHKVSLKDIESGCYNATITIGSTSQTFQILKK